MTTLDKKLEELLIAPFAVVENIYYGEEESNDFFDEARYSISKRNLGTVQSILAFLLVEALETVYEHDFDDEDCIVDENNCVSKFLKILSKHKSFGNRLATITVPIRKYKAFKFTEHIVESLSDISLTKVVQIFKEYLALVEKTDPQKSVEELEKEIEELKNENSYLKEKQKNISNIVSEL
jgi:hypothetical protein